MAHPLWTKMVYSLCHSTRLRQSRGPRGQRLEGGVHAPPERVWGLESFPWCFPIQQPSFLVEHVIGRTKLYKYPSPDVAFSSSIFCKFFCILLSAFLSLSLSLSQTLVSSLFLPFLAFSSTLGLKVMNFWLHCWVSCLQSLSFVVSICFTHFLWRLCTIVCSWRFWIGYPHFRRLYLDLDSRIRCVTVYGFLFFLEYSRCGSFVIALLGSIRLGSGVNIESHACRIVWLRTNLWLSCCLPFILSS